MTNTIAEEMKRFHYLTSGLGAAYYEAALRLGLSDSALLILYTLCGCGDACPLRDIARLSGVSRQTVHSALRRLEERGVLYRESAGGREKRVCLTEQGKALAERGVLRLIALENGIFGAWTEEERSAYLELTQRYLSAFRERLGEL